MSQFHRLSVASVRQETRDAIVVTFAVPPALADVFAYQQGQHLTLRTLIDGEDVRRSYSICAAVQERSLRVAIKRAPGGLFSNWACDHLQAGATLDVMAPMGHFNVPLSASGARHYVAFAAGSGITPILSIVKTTLLAEPNSRFTVFYGNRASSTILFKDELADLKNLYMTRLNLAYVMSREQQDIDLFNGRITKDKCARLIAHWMHVGDIDVAFLCGPEQMTRDVSEALCEAGMPKQNIKTELFAAAVSAPRRQARAQDAVARKESVVTVVLDGNRSSFTMARDRESILDAGLRAGIDMRYACKAGVCATCRCKLIDGKVDMDANHALEDYEIARGYVLGCQSFPVTDSVTVDFDQSE